MTLLGVLRLWKQEPGDKVIEDAAPEGKSHYMVQNARTVMKGKRALGLNSLDSGNCEARASSVVLLRWTGKPVGIVATLHSLPG